MAEDSRPVYLNLYKIKLPVTGIISIFHRLSGIILFLFIPTSLYYLQQSLINQRSFELVGSLMLSPASRFLILLVIWSFVHHFITGIRFLLIDLDLFLEKKSVRRSAWAVVIIEAIIMMAIIKGLFL